jgi:membrane associated rhomboid family serine protease
MHAPDVSFSDLRSNLLGILHAPVSWAWVAVIIAVQMFVDTFGGATAPDWWFENLGLSRGGFLSGKIWQLLSHGLLHAGWRHVGLNALLVLLVGSRIEHVAGSAVMARCMVLGITAGGLFHLLLGAGLLIGLSGGCFALLLLLTTLSPQSRMLPLPLSGRSLGGGILVAALLLALINPEIGVPGFAPVGRLLADHGMGSWFRIGHACHLGGGVVGWLYGRWILRPRVTLARLCRDRARRESK